MRAVPDRVRQEVHDDLLDAQPVAKAGDRFRRVDLERATRARQGGLQARGTFMNQVPEVAFFEVQPVVARGNARNAQQILDEPRHPFRLLLGDLDLSGESFFGDGDLRFAARHACDPLELELERAERCLQFMRSDRHERIVLALRFLRLGARHFLAFQKSRAFLLGEDSRGDVANELDTGDDPAHGIAERGGHDLEIPVTMFAVNAARGDMTAAVLQGSLQGTVITDDLAAFVRIVACAADMTAEHALMLRVLVQNAEIFIEDDDSVGQSIQEILGSDFIENSHRPISPHALERLLPLPPFRAGILF